MKFYWIWISYLIAILISKLPTPRGLNFWKIKWVNMIKVQFSHGLVKNWLKLLIEEDESINKIKVRKIRKKSTIGFGFGNRPKAEFHHSLLFCFGRLWKMQLRSLPAYTKSTSQFLVSVDRKYTLESINKWQSLNC